MKTKIILLFMVLLVFFGCLELLRYSEGSYTHTIGILANKSRVCFFEMNKTGTFSYDLLSPAPINMVIAEKEDVSFNETTGEPFMEGFSCIGKAYKVNEYSEDVGLSEGPYIFIVESESKVEILVKTNVKMNCETD